MSLPLVSVIIPVYNREHCVRRAIDSVLTQTPKNFEIIVVDDGSQDGSVEILKTYGDGIRLICQKNAGASAARNAGLRAACGQWIAFLDSDDEWRPGKLECQLQLLEKYGAKVCYSRCVAENGEPLPDLEQVSSTLREPDVYHVADPVEFLSRARSHPYLQSMVFDRQLLEAAGFFDQTLHAGEDTLWLFKLSLLGDCLYVDRPFTVIHRDSENSLTHDRRPAATEKRYDAIIRVQSEIYLRLRGARPAQTSITRHRLAYSLGCRAELACAAGNFASARALARDAFACAGDFRTVLRCATLWLAPRLWSRHFRKKWYHS